MIARTVAAAGAAAAGCALIWAMGVEPGRVSRSDATVPIAGLDSAFDGYRILHLSDFEAEGPSEREDQVAAIARDARPDLIVVTGDLARKRLPTGRRWRTIGRMAGWLGTLPSRDGVIFVQGHGEHGGNLDEEELKAVLEQAGVHLLLDEVIHLRRGASALAVAGVRVHEYADTGAWTLGPAGLARQGPGHRPGWLEAADEGAALWRDYEITGRLRFSSDRDWVGILAHGRLTDREDRFYLALRRGTLPYFFITAHGSAYSDGVFSWASAMPARRWLEVRVRVERQGEGIRLRARTWPSGDPEPTAWSFDYTDRSGERIEEGRPGLYAEGPGIKEFERMRIDLLGPDGGAVESIIPTWREPAGSDHLLRLLASAGRNAPMILLSHTPDIFPDAAELGIPLTLAGHTQGGQVRLPWIGALVTDTRLGRDYAAGLFTRGPSRLYVNRGIGTTRIPIRFLCPPEAAVLTLRASPS